MRGALLAAALSCATLAAAAPSLVFPLADQTPPVARPGSPFVFDLLPGTFTSNATGGVSYSAAGLPSWLSLTSTPTQATLRGTPPSGDVGTADVTISARDSTGVANSTFQLVVSAKPAPVLNLDFAAQIKDESVRQFASATVLPGGSAISIQPGWSFSLGWSGDTFESSERLFYSAHLKDATSIPDWLEFSNTTLTFSSKAAPATPATFVVVVTASDVWGYSAAQTSFVLAVGNGQALEFGHTLGAINTTAYNRISYTLDASNITINGSAAKPSDYIISPDLSDTEWLSYDNTTRALTGTVPEAWINGTSAPLSIPVKLSSTNATNTLTNTDFIQLNIVPYYFTTNQLPNITTSNGTTFTYNIEPYLRNKQASYNATVDPKEAASWLLFYPENYTLVGNPPTNVSYNGIDVVFFGTQGGVTGSSKMKVTIEGRDAPPATGTPTPVPTGTLSHNSSGIKKIIIGVVVGVVGFLALLALLLWCFCRRRKQAVKAVDNEKEHEEPPRPSMMSNIRGFGTHRKSKRPPSLGVAVLTNSPAKSAADSDATFALTPTTPNSKFKASVSERSPRRLGPIKGLFGTPDPDNEEALQSQRSLDRHASFMGRPEHVAIREQSDSDKAPVPIAPAQMPRSLESGNSLESWESPRSFHWSDEDHYLPPLMPSDSATPTPGSTPGVLADEPTMPRVAISPPGQQARQLPGFYPRFHASATGQAAPFISVDDIPTSYSEFSELDRDRSRSSYSLNDSFRDPGSALGTQSSRFGSGFSAGHQAHPSEALSQDSSDSGSSFQAPSGLGRFTSSSALSSFSPSPSGEPAVVASAVVASAERPPAPMHAVHADTNVVDLTEQPRSLSVLAGPVMPAGLQPVPRRRASSSRRTTARIHATREHIVGPTAHAPPADEHLAVLGDTDDEAPPVARLRRP